MTYMVEIGNIFFKLFTVAFLTIAENSIKGIKAEVEGLAK